MENSVFHQGKAPPKQKNKAKLQKKTRFLKNFSTGQPSIFLKKAPTWLLLPESTTTIFQRMALDKMFPTVKESLQACKAFQTLYPKDSFQFTFAQNVYGSQESYESILVSIRNASSLNRKLRFQFKRLLNIYRLRKFQVVNTEDIVTLEPIQKPVRIYNWNQKKIYTFEARPLLSDSVNRLLYHEEFFLHPKEPRNLLTNEPFRYSELLSIHKQLLSYGLTNWVWECFAKSNFSKEVLVHHHEMPIQLFLLDTLIKKGTEATIYDIVVDFILAEYEYHNHMSLPPEGILYHLLKFQWNHAFMKQWIHQCHYYWHLRLRKVDDFNKNVLQIHLRTREFVRETHKLIELYNTTR